MPWHWKECQDRLQGELSAHNRVIDSADLCPQYVPEFWIEQTLFCMTSSALRSANRVIYASMLPRGREAHFFGLELTLDLATGWINPLVQSVIQNKTHNLRQDDHAPILLQSC